MSETAESTGAVQFDATDYIRKANEKEHSKSDVKPAAAAAPEEKAPTAADAPDPDDDPAEVSARKSRSERRLLRRLGEAEGRNKAYEEMLAKLGDKPGETKVEPKAEKTEDSEPQQKDFKTWDEYTKALATWSARRAVKTEGDNKAQLDALREEIRAMETKAEEDRKSLPDWDQVQKDAEEDGPEFNPAEHSQFMLMLGRSDVKAFVLYHLAKHPAELEKLLELTEKDPQRQILLFKRLEGRVEALYAKEAPKDDKKDPAAKKEKTPAERDAVKHKPSETVATRGGSAPATKVEPYLGDGKTVNPAWLAQRNEREGRR